MHQMIISSCQKIKASQLLDSACHEKRRKMIIFSNFSAIFHNFMLCKTLSNDDYPLELETIIKYLHNSPKLHFKFTAPLLWCSKSQKIKKQLCQHMSATPCAFHKTLITEESLISKIRGIYPILDYLPYVRLFQLLAKFSFCDGSKV